MQMEALVRMGRGKDRCEDRCLIGRGVLCDIDGRNYAEAPFFAAVADGVGGNRLGDMAAGYVLQQMAQADIGDLDSAEKLRRFIIERNAELIKLAGGISGARNMATTLTGVLISKESGWVFHAGNTRLYAIQGTRIKQITQDHTTYTWLMNAGRADEARMCNRSEITCCMGNGNPEQLNQLDVFELKNFSALMLTSDGIHDALQPEQIESVLSRAQGPDEACRLLCDTAQMLGSRDDMSVAIIF